MSEKLRFANQKREKFWSQHGTATEIFYQCYLASWTAADAITYH